MSFSSDGDGDGADGAQTILPTDHNTPSQLQPQPGATSQPGSVWRWRARLVAKIDIVNHSILILRTAFYLFVVDSSCVDLPCTLPGPSSLHWFYLHERGRIIPPVVVLTYHLNDGDTDSKSSWEASNVIKWYIIPYLIYTWYILIVSVYLWKVTNLKEETKTGLEVPTLLFWMKNMGSVLFLEILVDCYVLYTLASGSNLANPFVEILSVLLALTYMSGSFFVVYMFWKELRLRRNVVEIEQFNPRVGSQRSVVRTKPVANSISYQPFAMEEYAAAAYPVSSRYSRR